MGLDLLKQYGHLINTQNANFNDDINTQGQNYTQPQPQQIQPQGQGEFIAPQTQNEPQGQRQRADLSHLGTADLEKTSPKMFENFRTIKKDEIAKIQNDSGLIMNFFDNDERKNEKQQDLERRLKKHAQDNGYKDFLIDNDKEEVNLLNTYTVNAYYNPQNNSINFPCAAKKFITSDNYYDKLGSIGMVIAHEITHAFDSNGRKFNEKGEYYDWWTQKDSKNFDELSEKIVNYYSNYSVLGIPVDGKKTLGENIADLGALKCISSLAESHNATNEDYKRMYASYAKWTAYNMTKEYKKLLVTADTHSPNEVRVNAVLSSTDKFYEVYKINKNDKMYKPKEERVGIW